MACRKPFPGALAACTGAGAKNSFQKDRKGARLFLLAEWAACFENYYLCGVKLQSRTLRRILVDTKNRMKRREFLKAGLIAAAAVSPTGLKALPKADAVWKGNKGGFTMWQL